MPCESRPDFSELSPDRCEACGEDLDERGECAVVGCREYEIATHGPILYEAQLPWGRVPCATLRRAIEACAGQPWSRIVRAEYVPTDDDDSGLTDLELNVLEMGDCEGRDALIALIDGAVRAA
jgi:hypothetical protein